MAVIRVRGPLKKLAGDRADHELAGATVTELLQAFEAANPAAAGWILDERGQIRRHLNVFVNAEQAAGDTAVGDADHVDLVPAISGG